MLMALFHFSGILMTDPSEIGYYFDKIEDMILFTIYCGTYRNTCLLISALPHDNICMGRSIVMRKVGGGNRIQP